MLHEASPAGLECVRLVRFICYVHRRDKCPRGFVFWQAIGAAKYAYVHTTQTFGRWRHRAGFDWSSFYRAHKELVATRFLPARSICLSLSATIASFTHQDATARCSLRGS